MSETVIKAEHLYKEYKLGVISHGTLYRDIQSWWAKIRGKEDPNSLISSHHGQEAEKDSFLALTDISFVIKEGDRVGIIGKNGAGKSTLLKILSQITSPTKGTVTIHGKVGSLLEVGTGFHLELTGRENIFLNGSILGMNRHEISHKLDEIVNFAGIEKHLDTPVKRYSSGMMVRLGFAVAAHLDTDILIADEVLAVGDAEFQKKALGKMQDLSTGEGRTILFVSHNIGSVKKLCDKSLLLNKGEIIASGKTSDVIDAYQERKKADSKIIRTKDGLPVYISSVFTCDANGIEKSTFAFSDDIHIRICVVIKKPNPIMNLAIAFLSKDETRVFTQNKLLKDICNNDTPEIVVDYIIKGSFIAPSDYSFYIAINSHGGQSNYDNLYDICPIKIFDDGTEFSFADGFHYGFFIIRNECEWKLIK
jgi:lipopolysaccharide transport system ATP-binding protein